MSIVEKGIHSGHPLLAFYDHRMPGYSGQYVPPTPQAVRELSPAGHPGKRGYYIWSSMSVPEERLILA